jgi:hypothetical protein
VQLIAGGEVDAVELVDDIAQQVVLARRSTISLPPPGVGGVALVRTARWVPSSMGRAPLIGRIKLRSRTTKCVVQQAHIRLYHEV